MAVAIYLGLVLAFLGFLFTAGITLVKICLFSLDKFAVFCASCYYTHVYFSSKFSSGYARYFWDIVLGLIAVGIYTSLFMVIYHKFKFVGKILNFLISLAGAVVVYGALVYMFVMKEKSYFLPLLNHKTANYIANFVIMGIIGIVVWLRREFYLSTPVQDVRENDEIIIVSSDDKDF